MISWNFLLQQQSEAWDPEQPHQSRSKGPRPKGEPSKRGHVGSRVLRVQGKSCHTPSDPAQKPCSMTSDSFYWKQEYHCGQTRIRRRGIRLHLLMVEVKTTLQKSMERGCWSCKHIWKIAPATTILAVTLLCSTQCYQSSVFPFLYSLPHCQIIK